jgi:hypothetical protein
MYSYETVTAATEGLRKRGFDLDFNIAFDQITCQQNGACLNPDQFEIVEHYRFEGNSDPADAAIVFAIESKSGDLKGLLIDGYGPSAAAASGEMIRKLSVHPS